MKIAYGEKISHELLQELQTAIENQLSIEEIDKIVQKDKRLFDAVLPNKNTAEDYALKIGYQMAVNYFSNRGLPSKEEAVSKKSRTSESMSFILNQKEMTPEVRGRIDNPSDQDLESEEFFCKSLVAQFAGMSNMILGNKIREAKELYTIMIANYGIFVSNNSFFLDVSLPAYFLHSVKKEHIDTVFVRCLHQQLLLPVVCMAVDDNPGHQEVLKDMIAGTLNNKDDADHRSMLLFALLSNMVLLSIAHQPEKEEEIIEYCDSEGIKAHGLRDVLRCYKNPNIKGLTEGFYTAPHFKIA